MVRNPSSYCFNRERWAALCTQLAIPAASASFDEIQSRYSGTTRFYHGVSHIENCLVELDLTKDLAGRVNEVEFSIWMHDIVYETHRGDNELRSAEFAAGLLGGNGCAEDIVERIVSNILATTHAERAVTAVDQKLIVDIDLCILGQSEGRYEAYESNIRREYAWVPWETYCQKRKQILTSFLERDQIYQTDRFVHKYEAAARVNLNQSIKRLDP